MSLHKASLFYVSTYYISTRLSLTCFVDIVKSMILSNVGSVGPNGDEAQDCLSALFLTDPRDDRAKLINTKGIRVDGTCQWIKNHALYNSWLRSPSQLLWLSGGPGKGKTMLSIFLAEELEQTARLPQNKLFLQYFCDNKDEKRNTAVTILRGFIYQLLRFRHQLFNHILAIFKIQKESLFSFEPLWKIFEIMICDPTLEDTYCVLDGLDECDEASLKVLLERLAALFSTENNGSSACHLNLLIVSRDLPDCIPELLSSFPHLCLDPDADTEINNDIDLFIKTKAWELSRRKQYPEKLRVHVENVFRHRAQGTFLWIGIVAQELEKYKVTEVERTLDLFPRGPDQLYARILLRIDSGRREIAARILRWVVMAVRPLTLSELRIAIETAAEPSTVAFDPDQKIRDQVSYCGYFLIIKENRVSLIHQSAKDYLLRKTHDSDPELEFFRIKEEVANLEIARRCLEYLHTGALENREPRLLKNDNHLRAFPLLSYAALHWPEHARFLARSEDIFDLSHPFYHEKSSIRRSWLKEYWASRGYGKEPPESFTLLHLASYSGILPLAENLVLTTYRIKWLGLSYHLNRRDGRGMTALLWAASSGHEAIVRLLLENGAHMEVNSPSHETALVVAVSHSHEALVRLLLEKGANMEAKEYFKKTVLIVAASNGHEALVRLLLEKGANIEANSESGTALIAAARWGYEAIVQLLLEKGAKIEAKIGFDLKTALIVAASHGHEALVRLLLEKGANIEANSWSVGASIEANAVSGTALILAARNGHEAVVRLLLEKGANMEIQGASQKTALVTALGAPQGIVPMTAVKAAIVRLLLEKGANIEARDFYQMTALIAAANYGLEDLVRLLLEKGANIEAQDQDLLTALFRAAKKGHEATVRLLLEKGANIEARDNHQMTALITAAEQGHKAIVQLLLEKGADINAQDRDGETALMKAEKRGHDDKDYFDYHLWERLSKEAKKRRFEDIIQLLTPQHSFLV